MLFFTGDPSITAEMVNFHFTIRPPMKQWHEKINQLSLGVGWGELNAHNSF
jgi:hypothetical protein